MEEEKIALLRDWIANSDNIVFFGGAGVSTESGIPDFRSVDGLYSQTYDYPPESILSYSFFRQHPEVFFRFYREKLMMKGASPNQTHRRLAELEKQGKLKCVITQNVDGLHQAAGCESVIELHGSTLSCRCDSCRRRYPIEAIDRVEGVPHCECGGILRPNVVMYEEGLDQQDLRDAIDYIRAADVLIVGGTSLVVYPAAGLLNYYRGNKLVLINLAATPRDVEADLVIHSRLGEVFARV